MNKAEEQRATWAGLEIEVINSSIENFHRNHRLKMYFWATKFVNLFIQLFFIHQVKK